jgi:hypothetical protein
MKTMAASRRSVRMGNKDDGCVMTQCRDAASGQVLKMTVVSGRSIRTGNEDVVASRRSVRTGHEDDGSVTTRHQDG